MASSSVQSKKSRRRMESRKSHSWWWDSHISPKNSKWLAENLEEMDHNVKRMLKLIEEDADSFSKKAEMYYQKRPELISLVEDFYRMYRSLAERYDQVTGELRRNIPLDLQSQGSGISDIGSEVPYTSPSPDHRRSRPKSGSRAADFDFLLGSGGSTSSDVHQKEEDDDSSSSTDSDTESDGSTVNNYPSQVGNEVHPGLQQKRIIELENEVGELKEKLQMQLEENGDSSHGGSKIDKSEEFLDRIAAYEQDLNNANEKIWLLEEEIARLKIEVQTNPSLTDVEPSTEKSRGSQEADPELQMEEAAEPQGSDSKIQALAEELRITKDRLESSVKEIFSLKKEAESNIKDSERICNLQDQIESAKKDIASWKDKLNSEKREVAKLQERITRLKTSLSDRDNEIQDLKIAVSDAEQKIFPEKAQIKAEISRLLEERNLLEEQLREWESRGRYLEDDIRKVEAEKSDMETSLNLDIKQLKLDISNKTEDIKRLSETISTLQLERSQLNVEVVALKAEAISRDDKSDQMEKHLHQLHMEHVQLIAGAERAHKLSNELRSKAEELEKEVERQKAVILEGAEEKREAIRQLCYSLEHYRNGYQSLLRAFIGHKRVPVLAS